MGILNNDTVIVDAILTKLGRDKLRQGEPLGITQYAFGDTGVDYNLYNPNHPSGSDAYGQAITGLPQLEAVPDDDVFMRSILFIGCLCRCDCKNSTILCRAICF